MKKSGTKSGQIPQTDAKESKAKVRYHTSGAIRVGIYQFPDRETVFWDEGEGRRRKNFTKDTRTADANAFADAKVKELAVKLQGDSILLQGADAVAYKQAMPLLSEFGHTPLNVILHEAAAALKHSGAASLMDCAKLYRTIHGQVKQITVTESVAEFLLTLKDGSRHHDDLTRYLTRFKEKFGKQDLLSVRRPDLESWLQELGVSSKTFAHYHAAVSQFMTWAQGRAYLPDTTHEAKKVQRPKPRKVKSKECFSPEEVTQLLAEANPLEAACLALQAFLGLRLEEICPYKADDAALAWSDIKWEQNAVHIRAEVGKTGERYIHHFPVNLKQWLKPFKKHSGKVCTYRQLPENYAKLSRKSGVAWKNNGLRHGYGSYRLALTKDYNLVSDEMGNSPAVLKRDYRVPQTEQSAKAWFAITPKAMRQYNHGL